MSSVKEHFGFLRKRILPPDFGQTFRDSNFAYFPCFYKFKSAAPTVAYSDANPYIYVGKRLGRVFHKVFLDSGKAKHCNYGNDNDRKTGL